MTDAEQFSQKMAENERVYASVERLERFLRERLTENFEPAVADAVYALVQHESGDHYTIEEEWGSPHTHPPGLVGLAALYKDHPHYEAGWKS